MKLHEFQSKALLSGRGVNVPEGRVALTASEARDAALALGVDKIAVKSQVLREGAAWRAECVLYHLLKRSKRRQPRCSAGPL